jgi:hypothetical protein
MPLRDHFHPPLSKKRSWEELHGTWPTTMVMALNKQLPHRYVAAPQGGGTAVWAPPQPTWEVAAEPPDQDEYEVRIYDEEHERRLVAAVELVSPGNKDRPESRRAFVAKCAALLRQDVSVAIVDVVTIRPFNLYAELLAFIGQTDPTQAREPPPLYAAACRWRRAADSPGSRARLQTWAYLLTIGQPLPTLPLWLADDLAVPLELEASYTETCHILRIT